MAGVSGGEPFAASVHGEGGFLFFLPTIDPSSHFVARFLRYASFFVILNPLSIFFSLLPGFLPAYLSILAIVNPLAITYPIPVAPFLLYLSILVIIDMGLRRSTSNSTQNYPHHQQESHYLFQHYCLHKLRHRKTDIFRILRIQYTKSTIPLPPQEKYPLNPLPSIPTLLPVPPRTKKSS